jgi:beta-glucosidase
MRTALTELLFAASAAPLIAAPIQPDLGARTKKIIAVKGPRFKDLNANGRIDACEDWRLPPPKTRRRPRSPHDAG